LSHIALKELAMVDEISITKILGTETVSKPATHLRVKVDTETGPLALKVSVNAAHELREHLAQLPPKIGFQSPVEKL
jgi:hypothetical protein